MSKTALIIVDVQYDFLPPSGALAVPEGNQIIPRIKDHLSNDTGKWRSVIATQVRPSITCNITTDNRIITLKDIYHSHRVIVVVNLLKSLLSKMAGGGRRNMLCGLIIV